MFFYVGRGRGAGRGGGVEGSWLRCGRWVGEISSSKADLSGWLWGCVGFVCVFVCRD